MTLRALGPIATLSLLLGAGPAFPKPVFRKMQQDALRELRQREQEEREKRKRALLPAGLPTDAERQSCQLWGYHGRDGRYYLFPLRIQLLLNSDSRLFNDTSVDVTVDWPEDESLPRAYLVPGISGTVRVFDVNGELVRTDGTHGSANSIATEMLVVELWGGPTALVKGGAAAARAYKAARETGQALKVGTWRGFLANRRAMQVLLGRRYFDLQYRLAEAQKTRVLKAADSQLQHAFKHAPDFGIVGNQSKASLQTFREVLEKHVANPESIVIAGKYRGRDAVHFLDPSTRLNVIVSREGDFLSAWRLSDQQFGHVMSKGLLGGGG